MKLAFFGTGYVGLVAAACFADKGNSVVCVDVDAKKIEGLNRGVMPIYEQGLAELVARNKERLVFTTDAKSAVEHSEILFLAVGTPQKKDSQDADLQYLEAAAISIARAMDKPKIVVIKSTVPVGTASHIRALMERHTAHAVSLVSNPEFLKEGDAIRDFEMPDRVVIGSHDVAAIAAMKDLYEPFFRRSDRLIVMNNESAELTKYGCNIMLAARVAIMNELARLAEATGADVSHVRQGVGSDSRIGTAFLFPGPGYGGSCFPKDVREATALSKRINLPLHTIPSIDVSNEAHKRFFAEKTLKAIRGEHRDLQGKRVAVWGLAFKHKTDDIRESPALTVIDTLLAAGAHVQVFDPEATENIKKRYGDKLEYGSQYDILEHTDALIITTDWNEFKHPDFPRMKTAMRHAIIVDGRNLFNPERVAKEGFTYHSVGRKTWHEVLDERVRQARQLPV
jgi:UDPglucose 6-dehydrogenase